MGVLREGWILCFWDNPDVSADVFVTFMRQSARACACSEYLRKTCEQGRAWAWMNLVWACVPGCAAWSARASPLDHAGDLIAFVMLELQ